MGDKTILVVDFAVLGLDKQLPQYDHESVQTIANLVHTAFSTIGFVYLKNHGITEAEISEVRQAGDSFFNLSADIKRQYLRPTDGRNFGWVSLGRERLNPARPGDLKEAFNVCELHNETQKWPETEAPNFKPVVLSFFNKCKELTFRILNVVGIGLKLKDPSWLSSVHQSIGTEDNATALRLLFYPPLPDNFVIKPGQVRCGEHSDYGAITLLFQDDVGGLEVLPVNGEYVPAKPIDGTVLVNIGDLMQRWTADKLISTTAEIITLRQALKQAIRHVMHLPDKHRVLVPDKELKKKTVRRSLAFFVHPDNEVVIQCLDGSNKYPPITSMGYLQQRFAATY